ncbi:hypothetical protein Tco_0105490 [Tanacetum coccineum]
MDFDSTVILSSSKESEVNKRRQKDKVQTINLGSTAHVQPSVIQVPILKPDVAPKTNPNLSIPYPSRLNEQKLLHFYVKSLLSNKEKLFELANTPLNENCSAVLLKKFLEKLGDPNKFLIPCDFLELEECLALADLGASINNVSFHIEEAFTLGTYSYSHDSRARKPTGCLSG